MEGTDEKLRQKLRETQETNGGKRLGRTRGVRAPKVFSSTALPPSLSSSHFHLFFAPSRFCLFSLSALALASLEAPCCYGNR